MIGMQLKGNILEALRKADDVLKKQTAEAVKRASTIVWGEAIKQAPVGASGQLRKSIRRDLFPTKAYIFPGVKYARDVHEGRTPAQVQADFKQVWQSAKTGSLNRWAKQRGLNPFAVANAMKQKGTRANPFFDRTKENTDEQVQKELGSVLNETVRKLAGK